MMRTLLLRTLYDKRWFVLGWSFALGGMAVLMVAMFPALSKGMADIAASIPPQLQGLIGDVDTFSHLDSFLGSQLYDIRIPLFLMIMAVILAQSVGASFEDKGALRTVLSGKSSRSSWFIQTWYGALAIFVVAITITGIATYVAAMGIGESLSYGLLIKLALISLSFAMTVFTIVFSVGAITGSRSVALAVGVGLITVSFILEAGSAVEWLDAFQYVSLLHYYDAGQLLKSGLDLVHQLVILGLMLVFFLAGLLFFRRRDIS